VWGAASRQPPARGVAGRGLWAPTCRLRLWHPPRRSSPLTAAN
jgi:hypothetical protein